MSIEQSFRNNKNMRVGLGLEHARSRSAARFGMLLWLAHLASFVQRLIDERAKEQQLELDFLARYHAARPEISVLTLGRRILDASSHFLRQLEPWRAMAPLAKQAAWTCAVSA